MKRGISFFAAAMLIAAFLLTACNETAVVPEDGTAAETAAENIFTVPQNTSEPISETAAPKGTDFGSIGHGFSDKSLKNEKGVYQVYSGGELHIGYQITANGFVSENGIGLLLLLDGQPQPYRTAEDGETRYMHIFHFDEGGRKDVELILTPVTGKAGDTLELTGFHVINPTYYPSETVTGFMQTNGSAYSGTQLVFQADPPAAEPLPVTERVLAQSVETADLSSWEIEGATAQSLQTSTTFRYSADHPSSSGNLYGISSDGSLTLTGEIFGAPMVEWSLIVYVDHQPVTALPENRIAFHTENGKKTVVTMTLDMSDFDGEGIVYGVLCARNWRDPAVSNSTDSSTVITPTYYLTDAASHEEMGEKYGWQDPH